MTTTDLPKCRCGEPIESGRVLCDACVKLVNERAMATMTTVIGELGLGHPAILTDLQRARLSMEQSPVVCGVCEQAGGHFLLCMNCYGHVHDACSNAHDCPDEEASDV